MDKAVGCLLMLLVPNAFPSNVTIRANESAVPSFTEEPSVTPAAADGALTTMPVETLVECDLATQRRLTVIKSAAFPNPYGPGIDCRYSIGRFSPDFCSVTFLFNVFDLQDSPGCQTDWIDIAGERMCGSKPSGFTRTVHFAESEVVMSFHSDNDTSGLGFMVTVVQQDCPPPICDQTFSGSEFEIKSPNYPEPYDNRHTCEYVVRKSSPAVCRLTIRVREFDVEYGDRCETDFLELGDERFCGILAGGQIINIDFPEKEIIGHFKTDYATTRSGFDLEVSQEECPQQDVYNPVVPDFTPEFRNKTEEAFTNLEPNENNVNDTNNVTNSAENSTATISTL